jgi:hypothetical protein
MAIAPPNASAREFLNALEMFMESNPRDLPDGALDTMKELHGSLKGYTGTEQPSPGEREAVEAQVGTNEAQPYPKAATGPDKPSPGQREYEAAVAKATEALSAVHQAE